LKYKKYLEISFLNFKNAILSISFYKAIINFYDRFSKSCISLKLHSSHLIFWSSKLKSFWWKGKEWVLTWYLDLKKKRL